MRILSTSTVVLLVLAASGLAGPAAAQDDDWCREHRYDRDDDRRGWACEVREFTMAAPAGVLRVDGGNNGGIRVEAWDRSDVRVVMRVFAQARSDADAEDLVRRVTVREGDRIRAEGPSTGRREHWGVSYVVYVPRASDLDLETHNGGIEVRDVSGAVRFDAVNGGVSLWGLGGDVQGQTRNGALRITLAGTGWDGPGMDVRTTNGSVRIVIPEAYNARIETGTVNGGIDVDFPIMVQGQLRRALTFDVGRGGRLIRARTTNGQVRLLRR